MQNNWYILYTKPKWEKKVANALKRRKIESFLPLQKKQTFSFRKMKTAEEPLFENYIFVKIGANEILRLKSVRGVINLVYWLGEPATIKNHEIELMKNFIGNYENISLEKTKIRDYDVAKVKDNIKYSFSGNLLTIKNTVAKINLPSIGLALVAKTDMSTGTENTFGLRGIILQS